MQVPKIYHRIAGLFDMRVFRNPSTFESDFKNNFANGILTNIEIDEFVTFIDQVTDDSNSEAYCQEVWEKANNGVSTLPGQFRGLLKYIRDLIASIKQ